MNDLNLFVTRMRAIESTLDDVAKQVKVAARSQYQQKLITQAKYEKLVEWSHQIREQAGNIGQATADALASDVLENVRKIEEATSALGARTDALHAATSIASLVASLAGAVDCIAVFAITPSVDNTEIALRAMSNIFDVRETPDPCS